MSNSKQNVVHLQPAATDSGLSARIWFVSDSLCLKYTGTREDLISEGLATADMFPTGRKRVKREDEKYWGGWEVRKRSGDLFELRLPAPEPTEAAWDPERWRNFLYSSIDRRLGALWHEIIESEQQRYGVATHRLSEVDRQELLALFHDALDVISHARIERANGPHLERVK